MRDKVPVKVQELLGAEGGEQNPQLISNLAGRPFVLAHIPDRSKMDLTKPGTKKSPQPGDTIANSIGMKLAYIPAGEFMMGSPADEGFDNEHPQHAVEITKPFYLGVTESLRLLGEMGPEAKRAVPCLVKVINDPSRNYRRQAAMALLKIDPEAAKEVNAEEIASSRPTSED